MEDTAPRSFHLSGWCLEHERLIAKCSELAWRDHGVRLFSNCEADAKQADTGAAVNGPGA